YGVSGAQHGTSGNDSERLRQIAGQTNTTKANVATALQMISWGLEVNDFGNAAVDENGAFVKVAGEGVTGEMWGQMVAAADALGLTGGAYKKLNLPFENKLLGQEPQVRERMTQRVEDFVYHLLVNVFNARDTAPLAIDAILAAGSYDAGAKAERIEDPHEWTEEALRLRAQSLAKEDDGPEGDFDD
ncbi:MAG: ketose-bisphosphate aldolase, partial [Proteobacteria bacterium]|nr:ketose-bisphosphate aldolase [Pseudomonadota bacterium]